MCYFIPAALNSLGIVNGEESNLYFVASRYLLPASLILLCLSIDLKGIYNLGTQSHRHVFCRHHRHCHWRAAGAVAGQSAGSSVLGGDAPDAYWRGLSTVAGSWIGGGANQAALKEISGTLDDQFSIMLIVDVFVANLWMPFLLFGAGIREKIDGWLRADASAVNELQAKVEQLQAKSARIASFPDLMVIVAVAFGVALSHLAADNLSVSMASWLDSALAGDPDSPAIYLSSVTKGFSGLWSPPQPLASLSFTCRKSYEGAGAANWIGVSVHLGRHNRHEDGHWQPH